MRRRRSGAARRWAVVGSGVAVLLSLPSLIGALPASDAGTPAADLRRAALASTGVAFSGYAQAAGGLALPVGEQLTGVADLLSDRTTMRTWYRGPADWRVDVVSPTGETGVHADASGTWTWDYVANAATRTPQTALALPTAPDLLPSALGRRLLSEAGDGELSRFGADRVAGRDALGLRVVPADQASSVGRVDVWVDAASGVPLRVQVFGEAGGEPAVDTSFLELDLGTPAADVVDFTLPPAAELRAGQDPQLLQAATRGTRGVLALPDVLAGLDRRRIDGAPATVGVYGRGVTLLTVSPLPGRAAAGLRSALADAPGAVVDDLGVRIAAGPLGLMLADGPDGTVLLTGTVTLDALAAAAGELTGGTS
ncbi:transcriptional regulator [Modestobacter sp. L9-4]|uniref:sigma-E factor regulatory protein RseB domain-containing protein n=1 Tax=Modestobacter sp. L9-4 TaxID=2851567 RepID=UPI001C773D9D|nr:sigma-E factor regulatory protein RseB domain-containing protein [Modestobacter sp. L9-4]QXG75733.1 transcriptional regulator [Modestobacter sp. L9-4]